MLIKYQLILRCYLDLRGSDCLLFHLYLYFQDFSCFNLLLLKFRCFGLYYFNYFKIEDVITDDVTLLTFTNFANFDRSNSMNKAKNFDILLYLQKDYLLLLLIKNVTDFLLMELLCLNSINSMVLAYLVIE